MTGVERAIAECGQWWFMCGPSFDMRTPGYWVGSILGYAVAYLLGYKTGQAHHPTPQAGEEH